MARSIGVGGPVVGTVGSVISVGVVVVTVGPSSSRADSVDTPADVLHAGEDQRRTARPDQPP